MNRQDILRTPEYWTTRLQTELYNRAERFMQEHRMNRKQLAEYLGVSPSYVTQLLNGDFDHKLSKFVELSMAFGYIPQTDFVPLATYEEEIVVPADISGRWRPDYKSEVIVEPHTSVDGYETIADLNPFAA